MARIVLPAALVASLLLGFGVGHAIDRTVPAGPPPLGSAGTEASIGQGRETALVQATRRAAPAVVGITLTSEQVVYEGSGDPFVDLFLGAVPRKRKAQSWGSGVLYDQGGWILTNHHVVEAALDGRSRTVLQVTLPDGRRFQGKVIGSDPDNDVAVVRISGDTLPVAALSKDVPMLGEWALAIGNPYGYLMDDPHPSVTAGVVSAVDRDFTPGSGIALRHVIQTDAAINPGNSGGALVNALGEVIGINTFILTGGGGSEGNIGLGFAVPIQRAVRIAQELRQYGHVRDFSTGLSSDPSVAQAMGIGPGDGVLVSEVLPRSPGAKAGIQPGDVIVAADGRKVGDLEELQQILRQFRVGDRLKLELRRNGVSVAAWLLLEETRR
jgi:serine protease Do